ncbi:MAG TPA: ATP-binding protein, partial [Castellaniella sp.]|nr:ATP-binding protein [Castellaniella sp.]
MTLGAWGRSLRLRLLAGTLAWVLLTVAAAGWGIQRLFSQHIQAQLQSELTIHLDQLTAFIQVDPAGALSLSAAMTDPRFSQPFSGLYWQVG